LEIEIPLPFSFLLLSLLCRAFFKRRLSLLSSYFAVSLPRSEESLFSVVFLLSPFSLTRLSIPVIGRNRKLPYLFLLTFHLFFLLLSEETGVSPFFFFFSSFFFLQFLLFLHPLFPPLLFPLGRLRKFSLLFFSPSSFFEFRYRFFRVLLLFSFFHSTPHYLFLFLFFSNLEYMVFFFFSFFPPSSSSSMPFFRI